MTLKQPHNVPIDGRPYGLSKHKTYQVSHDWYVRFERDDDEYRFIVRRGYIYDGASSPRITWGITRIRPDGLVRAAATLHDPIYEFEGELNNEWITCEKRVNGKWQICHRVWTREEADGFFKELMERAGYDKYRVFMAHQAVRKGGWTYWRG